MDQNDQTFHQKEPRIALKSELLRVHSPRYVDQVINDHRSGEWSGSRPDLSELASLFVGGTLVALESLLSGNAKTALHFPGAKHHAQFDHSSGFCVFNDFAIAADIASKDFGLKVAILDVDAHHGDGTENLTADNPNVCTTSVHEWGIFPGTGRDTQQEKWIFNFPVDPSSRYDQGNNPLMLAASAFVKIADSFKADIIFVACGADGHHEDPLSSLEYSTGGFAWLARDLRRYLPELPILVGGAGGYLPDTRTPEVWATFASELTKQS